MILPIFSYRNLILRKIAHKLDENYPDLLILIENMWKTMKNAKGVGLAAPQIGKSIQLFLIDTTGVSKNDNDYNDDEKERLKNFKKVFINPTIEYEEGEEWLFEEGCLSIPSVVEKILRKKIVNVVYQDENFFLHKATYTGLIARIFQHEYDHLKGILFVDKISSFKRRLIKNKLNDISKGKIAVDYEMC